MHAVSNCKKEERGSTQFVMVLMLLLIIKRIYNVFLFFFIIL